MKPILMIATIITIIVTMTVTIIATSSFIIILNSIIPIVIIQTTMTIILLTIYDQLPTFPLPYSSEAEGVLELSHLLLQLEESLVLLHPRLLHVASLPAQGFPELRLHVLRGVLRVQYPGIQTAQNR